MNRNKTVMTAPREQEWTPANVLCFTVEISSPATRDSKEKNGQEGRLGMTRKRRFVAIAGAIAVLMVFAGEALAKEITIRGKLRKTVEAGGWLIVVGNQKY